MRPTLRHACLPVAALVLAACGSAGSTTRSLVPTAGSSASSAHVSLPLRTGESIVFYRTDDARSKNTPFVINPDGSGEAQVPEDLTSGIWSPDGRQVVLAHLVPDPSPVPGAETSWIRPAVMNADGSGFNVLDAYPGRKMQLTPSGWSADGSRIYVTSGGEDVNLADIGSYTLRSSDGGDLVRVELPAPPDGFDQGLGSVAPDGSALLLNEAMPRPDQPDLVILSVVNADGTGKLRLSPTDPNTTVIAPDFWGGISEAWSPDGLRVSFCVAFVGSSQTGLFTATRTGSLLRQIVPSKVGASSVRYSPDGRLIAFTSEVGTDNQIWVVQPDGMGLKQLTDNRTGWVSIDPVWSPDGTKLLFQRKHFTPGKPFHSHDPADVTLWTMNADGTGQRQLSPTPLATDWIGSYAWWPAPPKS